MTATSHTPPNPTRTHRPAIDTIEATRLKALEPPTPAAANTAADPYPLEQARWSHAPCLPKNARLVSDTRDLTTGGLPIFAMRFGPANTTEVLTGSGEWVPLTNTAQLMDRPGLKEHNRQVRILRERNDGYITPQPPTGA